MALTRRTPGFRLLLALILLLAACSRNSPWPGPFPEADPSPTASSRATTFTPFQPLPRATTTPTPEPQPRGLAAHYHSGQTFLTWNERVDLNGERYRVYRSSAPINAENLHQAKLLEQVGKYSARVWASYFVDNEVWKARMTDRFVIQDNAAPLADGVGALVWTMAAEDFGGQAKGDGYYAVTVTPPGGEETFIASDAIGPVHEEVADPDPVEVSASPGIEPGPGGHFYLQYVDLRHINPTFHAPNGVNKYYGFNPADPNIANTVAYTFDYSVFTPTDKLCGGKVPKRLPVMIFLHGARGNRYPTPVNYIYPYCAYGVYPVDESETWWFGFARSHNYHLGIDIEPGDVVENFTEQRTLRMVYDLIRKPPGPQVDQQRIYLFGHSMGGTGSLAFAQRYPNVFAAIYSGQPVTNFRDTPGVDDGWANNVTPKWGKPAQNLPIAIFGPNHWADHLQKYNGAGVYDWEHLSAAFDPAAKPDRTAGEMAPFAVDHGTIDEAVKFPSQGQPLYPLLNASPRAWAGAVSEDKHQWSFFGWPLASFSAVKKVPFWGFQVVRGETVPGFSHLSSNESGVPTGPVTYNQTVLWSASWDTWDGAPIDTPTRWRMSFCAVAAGSQECNGPGAAAVKVDITPRRLQRFKITPGAKYDWLVQALDSGEVIASGAVTADAAGVITVRGVAVSPTGIRLEIQPHR